MEKTRKCRRSFAPRKERLLPKDESRTFTTFLRQTGDNPRFCEDLFSRDFREAALDGREYLVFWREEFSKSLLRSDEMLPR
jgi:hypothetical protein